MFSQPSVRIRGLALHQKAGRRFCVCRLSLGSGAGKRKDTDLAPAGGSGYVLGRFGRAQVCKTGASKGKTEVQAGQCSRRIGALAGPACRRKNTRRPAQRKMLAKSRRLCYARNEKRRKGKVRQESAFAENFTQTCFFAVGFSPFVCAGIGRMLPGLSIFGNSLELCGDVYFRAFLRPDAALGKFSFVRLPQKALSFARRNHQKRQRGGLGGGILFAHIACRAALCPALLCHCPFSNALFKVRSEKEHLWKNVLGLFLRGTQPLSLVLVSLAAGMQQKAIS